MRSGASGLRWAGAAVLGAGLLALVGSAQAPAAVAPRATGPASFAGLVAQVRPAVVLIETPSGLGSGVVYDARGDIVTNAHVVAGRGAITVQLGTSPVRRPATLVGAFAPDDLAVIRVPGAGTLRPARFGGAGSLRVGDWVLAIGNPLGLTSSVTDGIVSALGREVTEPSTATAPGATLPDTIQTSAAINPGNSGGALVDLAGQVVGIPTLGGGSTGASGVTASGIGFAIPSTIVTDIAGQIIRYGHVVNSHRADLGVSGATVVDRAGAPVGVAVEAVRAGGPAARAGIRVGDLITALAGAPVRTAEQLAETLADHRPDQRVAVALTDPGGARHTISVVLGTLPVG